tara:strand:+ start:253 stop:627 length:375 start_codon:yes stop_codon:yes gene_type:complete
MASELRVNTLKDAAGNNSIATSFVASGSAKAWSSYSGSGTTFRDSFNCASAVDNGTGDFTYNITNGFSNANYSFVTNAGADGGNSLSADRLRSGSTSAMRCIYGYDSTLYDWPFVNTSIHGDLA